MLDLKNCRRVSLSYADRDQSCLYDLTYVVNKDALTTHKKLIQKWHDSSDIADKHKLITLFEENGALHDNNGQAACIIRSLATDADNFQFHTSELHMHYNKGEAVCVKTYAHAPRKINGAALLANEERYFKKVPYQKHAVLFRENADEKITRALNWDKQELSPKDIKSLNRAQAQHVIIHI